MVNVNDPHCTFLKFAGINWTYGGNILGAFCISGNNSTCKMIIYMVWSASTLETIYLYSFSIWQNWSEFIHQESVRHILFYRKNVWFLPPAFRLDTLAFIRVTKQSMKDSANIQWESVVWYHTEPLLHYQLLLESGHPGFHPPPIHYDFWSQDGFDLINQFRNVSLTKVSWRRIPPDPPVI